jgi:hypothetical protein
VEQVTGQGVHVAGRAAEVLEPEAGRKRAELVTATYPLAEPPFTKLEAARHAPA